MRGLGLRVVELVEDSGMQWWQFEYATGVAHRTVRGWLYGERSPMAKNVVAIAREFGVSTDYLLGLDDEKRRRLDP